MIASDYIQMQKRLYQNRKFPEAVKKRRYEKAFETFGSPETRKQERQTLDEIIAQKQEAMKKEIKEINANEVIEYEEFFHLERFDKEDNTEVIDYGWER